MDISDSEPIGGLSSEDLELLTYLLEAEEGIIAPAQQPMRQERPDDLPLSFVQERLWFLDQLEPGTPAYNVPFAIRFKGLLDCAALQQSLQGIGQRHEILRTAFPAVDGQPRQVIAPAPHVPLPLIDLQALSGDARAGELRRLIAEEAARSFDLARAPLFSTSLLRLAEDDHVLLLSFHHIVFDGWSMGVFTHELRMLYGAFAYGWPAQLPRISIQYADFALWQRRWLQGPVLEEQLSYWRRQLQGVASFLELPTDRPRPIMQTYRGSRRSTRLPPELSQALAALGQRESSTLFMTLLAAFMALLQRYTGQHDLCVGSYVANRNRAETLDLIGYFVNTLALRSDLSGNPTFREALARVREVTLGAYAHQDLPFEQLLQVLQIERNIGYTPLFQVALVYQNTPDTTFELPGLTAESLDVERNRSNFDLTLWMWEEAQGLVARIEYNTDLFDATTVIRLLANFQTLLEGIARRPDDHLSDLSILSGDERQQILDDWTATQVVYPAAVCAHQLFEAQAARTPDAIVVVFDRSQVDKETRPAPSGNEGRQGDKETEDRRSKIEDRGSTILHPPSSILHPQSLTYAELNERANRLARYLRMIGVGPEVPVGILLERSPELLIAILGILKAGGAYVPLDPAYPAERLQFMLDDTQTPVVLTQKSIYDVRFTIYDLEESGSAIVNRKSKIVNPVVVRLDTDWDVIARASWTNPAPYAVLDNPAYIIYTSGSTGRSKGVVVQHRSLVNFIRAAIDAWAMRAADRVLQFASISWDTSAEEIYPCLVRGGTLVLRPAELESSDVFLRMCAAQALTVLDLPTAYWHELAADLDAHSLVLPPLLRLIIVGGERALQDRLAIWRRRAGTTVRLLNTYGATEATAVTTMYDIAGSTQDSRSEPRDLPIGKPIANITTYILDRYLQPAPIGVPGQLYIGGAGLARGYLNRPDLTAAVFIPNPFAQGMGDGGWGMGGESSIPHPSPPPALRLSPIPRLYRTGDLARWRADGNLEFLGRADQQVKIRGFRIEPGEIEAVLRLHPAVHDSVVVVREDTRGERRLVTYVVPKIEDRGLKIEDSGSDALDPRSSILDPLSSQLRGFLKERLPDYMVPSAFVLLDALPLNPNGKLDRRRLPAPDWNGLTTSTTSGEPRNPVEEVLVAIWSDVLGRDRIGVGDHFFEVGGHSLLATQIISRVRNTFQTELPLRALFEAPTIAGLAERITISKRRGAEPPAPAIQPRSRRGRAGAALSFAQQRLWFLEQLLPDTPAHNMALALRLEGALDLAALQQSLHALVRRHEALRTTFAVIEGQAAQVIAESGSLRLLHVDLHGLPIAQREVAAQRLAREEIRRRFDLVAGPLVRAALLHLDEREHALVITMHHIVSDDWSMGVVLRELTACYQAYTHGTTIPLPEVQVQYADFAVWQRERLDDAALALYLGYWKAQLAGPLPVLELPADRARPPVQTFHGARQPLALSPNLAEGLKALCRHEHVTLFMALLAGFQVLLYAYSGQEDLLIGSPVAGRNQAEVERVIGFFVNTLVLRGDLSGNPSFRELVRRVRDVALDAYAHQDLPFEKLVEALHPERDTSRHPLFQVMFVLQNAPWPALELSGLSVRQLQIDRGITQFDLTLAIVDAEADLTGAFEYNTDLFDSVTIARMSEHFQALLEHLVVAPDSRIADIPLVTAHEWQQLAAWNATERPAAGPLCLHEQIAALVARAPDAVAIVFDGPQPGVRGQGSGVRETRRQGDKACPEWERGETRSQESGVRSQESEFLTPNTQHPSPIPHPPSPIPHPPSPNTQHLTYRELDRRANGLAHGLRAAGVGRDVVVGICAERSVELAIGLLGILKAGGAYLPLDPDYPPDRLAFMLADARSPVLLTQRGRSPQLPGATLPVIFLDADLDMIAPPREAPPQTGVTPEHLAYVIYTSGSTGQPKGVMIAHRAIANTLRNRQNVYPLTADDRVLQASSISFDASVWDFFAPLIAGASLVLPRPGPYLGSVELIDLIWRHHVTTFLFPTPLLQVFLDGHAYQACRSIRRVFCGGQALSVELQNRFFAGLPTATLHNLYGPTEAAIEASAWDCRPQPEQQTVPIGRPIANTRLYLLDARLRPVPIGAVGELYIEGAGLARGYLNRPDLTAERFIPNPFVDFGLPILDFGLGATDDPIQNPKSKIQNGTRLYKTGDLARYRPDGALEFRGRADQQVKIRGFRIEPGEIEAVLGLHPSVRQCVVLVREDAPGEKRLVAYVVQGSGVRGQGSEDSAHEILIPDPRSLIPDLRAFLAQRLPAFMGPAEFVLLVDVPRLPNSKIDRRALPAPASRGPHPAAYAPPRTHLERAIAAIWQDVLQVERVGMHDNFFDLGGHSLLLMTVQRRLSDGLHHKVSVLDLLQYPSVHALATHLDAQDRVTPEREDDRSAQLAAGKGRIRQQFGRRQRAEPLEKRSK